MPDIGRKWHADYQNNSAFMNVQAGVPSRMFSTSPAVQRLGKSVTIRSDIYALGFVVHELFTGQRAFDAKTLDDLVTQRSSGTAQTPTTS